MGKGFKFSKESAQNAKDAARQEKQKIMREAGKRLTSAEKARMDHLNKAIKEADKYIDGGR